MSPHADRFILKGALMFPVWSGPASRSTLDIDLLGRIDNSLETIAAAMKDTSSIDVEDDGMSFNPHSVTAQRITEDADYEGVRVRLQGTLGTARISLQIDIGFGDVIVPEPGKVTYPVILDFPAPELSGYTMETTIAEKFQAMVRLGIANSRMKDFYDIWFLSRMFDFKGKMLAEAIARTFENRSTPVTIDSAVFDPSFPKERVKKSQWQGFIRKANLTGPPDDFEEILAAIRGFLQPPAAALAEKRVFTKTWNVSGSWR